MFSHISWGKKFLICSDAILLSNIYNGKVGFLPYIFCGFSLKKFHILRKELNMHPIIFCVNFFVFVFGLNSSFLKQTKSKNHEITQIEQEITQIRQEITRIGQE